jgi:hypothetical protein
MEFCPGLKTGRARHLLDMLPNARGLRASPAARDWALRQIEYARNDLWQAYLVSPHRLATREIKRQTRARLEKLGRALTATLEAAGTLEPLDLVLLARRKERAATWMDEQLSVGAAVVHHRAQRVIAKLNRLQKVGAGRPRIAREERAFVRSLAGIWVYFSGRDTSIARERGIGHWPFKDFVQSVGRTVLPGFSGKTACGDLIERSRAIRKRPLGPEKPPRRGPKT